MKKDFKNLSEATHALVADIIGKDFVVSSNKALFPLDETRNVSIELKSGITRDKFNQLVVRILHLDHGEVDSATFFFKDYLEQREYHANIKEITHIWKDGNSVGWYGPPPTDASLKSLQNEIVNWIKLWKKES
jgi:hypothetical protein